jgi:hypothetical protein
MEEFLFSFTSPRMQGMGHVDFKLSGEVKKFYLMLVLMFRDLWALRQP